MKKIALALVALLLVSAVGCTGDVPEDSGTQPTITVVSPFDSNDGNHDNFVAAYTAFEEETGCSINDQSATADEAWKRGVLDRFAGGNVPDVLFYFTGADANNLVVDQQVVPLSEIRKENPEYASNMKDSLIPVSPADGRQYAVPVNGYWEGLYVNKKVLAACGVAVPGSNYSWEKFLKDCQTIKDAGYTPIACSLANVPHYWFEYCTYNNGTTNNHTNVPEYANDATGLIWAAGLNDMKSLYESGYFPENTLTMSDDESCALMTANEAAFMIDGSWKLGWFQQNAADLEDFTVVYVPAKNERRATDIVSGLSMGYYITQKAWDDPVKREACIAFVMAMTTDEVVTSFGATSITALKEGTESPREADQLTRDALAMLKGVTAATAAAQDSLTPEARDALFANIPLVVTGELSPVGAISEGLGIADTTG